MSNTLPRAVVTGGAGFLGSWLCQHLLSEGWEVICIDNLVTGSLENITDLAAANFHFIEADISDPLPRLHRIDAVFHLASPASPVAYAQHPLVTLKAGSFGTHHAIELARENRARFVLASTSEVYGDPEVTPQPETYWGRVNPIGPRSVYDEAKRYAEALTYAFVRRGELNGGAVRIFNTYGPKMQLDDGRVVPTLMLQALTGRPLTVTGDGTQTRSFCFVTDTVGGIVAFASSSASGPINIGSDVEITINGLTRLINGVCRTNSPVVHVPAVEDDPARRRPDLTRSRRELGWVPRVPLSDGLARTSEWVGQQLDQAALHEYAPLLHAAQVSEHTSGNPTRGE